MLIQPRILTTLSIGCALAGGSRAQSIVVPDDTVRTIVALDQADGALQAAGFMDLDDGAIPTNRPYQVAAVGNELWITDDVLSRITRWNSFGTQQLGSIDLSPHRLRGLVSGFGSVWVAGGTPSQATQDYLLELSPAGQLLASHPMPGLINGVEVFGNQLLVAEQDDDDLLLVDPSSGAVTGTFHDSNGVTGIDLAGGLDVLQGGHVLCGSGLPPVGIFEYDAAGNQVAYYDTTALPLGGGVRGVHGLADGNIAFTSGTGVYRYDVGTGQIEPIVLSLTSYYFAQLPDVTLGVNECTPAVPNSTGRAATINATGSAVPSNNAVRLSAQDMPLAQFGYFLNSRTAGLIQGPGGSQGNLCVTGQIGRFNNLIGFTGNDGFFSITVDTTAMPRPMGTTVILPGETWRFQCWYRDVNPNPTSNFTNATAVMFQ